LHRAFIPLLSPTPKTIFLEHTWQNRVSSPRASSKLDKPFIPLSLSSKN
jgi:hypothetical protein